MATPSTGPLAGPEAKSGRPGSASLTCRLATLSDLDRVAAFSRQAAGVDIPAAYWRWRYFDNPSGPSGIAIALDGERIVGSMAACAVPFWVGGERRLASQLEQNDILKTHRSADLYFQLANTVFRELLDQCGIDFCYGIAVQETRDLSVVLMDFHEVGPIAKLVKLINPVPHLRKRLKLPLPRFLGAPLALRTRRAAGRALSGYSLSRFEHFSEIGDGGSAVHHARYVMASREPSYLAWRYVACPLQPYLKLQLRTGGELVGWVVCHAFEEQGVRYGVLDECFSSSEADSGAAVDLGVQAAAGLDVDAIVAWSPPATALHQALLSRGFAARPSPRSLIVRPIAPGLRASALSSQESWYYTIGDTDYWLFPVAQGWKAVKQA